VTFGVPRLADPIHDYGEPDIAVAPSGSVHVSGPQGTGVQRSIWNISVDGGDSYRIVDDLRFNDGNPVNCDQVACPSKSTLGPGGGDTEIYVTKNNQSFYNDLWALACFTAGTTKDDGKTVDSAPNGCSQNGLANADRQWMTAYDPSPSDRTISPYKGPTPVVYMAYNGPQVDMTTDGIDYTTSAGQYKGNTGSPWIVDQHTGKVMTITQDGNTLQLGVGSPDEAGKLEFEYNDIADRDDPPGLLFPTLSQDTDRNIYAVWTEDHNFQVYYTWASAADGWKKWAPVRQVSKPPAKVNVFSWSTSGGPGMLDVAWYGTPDNVQSPDDQAHQVWYLYFAQVDHANTTSPHMVQVQASPHPMHYNDICLQGTGCIASVGNRNLADFFKIVLDNAGRARIVYADTSNRLMEGTTPTTGTPPEGADHAGAPVDTVVTQSTGLNAWTGKPLAPLESTNPISGVNDPIGDALWQPLGGTELKAADITKATIEQDGDNLVIKVGLREGRLADVATATAATAAQLVVRWQVRGTPTTGDPIYYAQVEELPGGGAAPVASAGPARSVDLCSVSACKPNYVVYPGPDATRSMVDVGFANQTYTITVPLAAVGGPAASTVFEEVEAHVAAEPKSATVPDSQINAFPDETPTVVDATRTWNYKLGATGLGNPVLKVAAVQRPGCSVAGSTGGTSAGNDGSLPSCIAAAPGGTTGGTGGTGGSGGGRGGDDLATTGLDPVIPVGGLLLAGIVAVLVRRRRRAA
jgi:hypothetical protein